MWQNLAGQPACGEMPHCQATGRGRARRSERPEIRTLPDEPVVTLPAGRPRSSWLDGGGPRHARLGPVRRTDALPGGAQSLIQRDSPAPETPVPPFEEIPVRSLGVLQRHRAVADLALEKVSTQSF